MEFRFAGVNVDHVIQEIEEMRNVEETGRVTIFGVINCYLNATCE